MKGLDYENMREKKISAYVANFGVRPLWLGVLDTPPPHNSFPLFLPTRFPPYFRVTILYSGPRIPLQYYLPAYRLDLQRHPSQ